MDLLMNLSLQIQRLSLPLHSKMIPHRAVNCPLITVFTARRESFRCPYFRKLFMLPPNDFVVTLVRLSGWFLKFQV